MKKILFSGLTLLSFFAVAQNSWQPQATNFATNFGVDEISIVDANTVWVTAYDGSGAGTYPRAFSKTTNGGTTWAASSISGPPTSALISDIHAVDANTAYIVTAPHTGSAANGIWKTTNGGSSWTKQTSGFGTSSFANQVYFWDANNGWACGDPVGGKYEMYKTSNGGTTWTAVAGAPTPIAGQGSEFAYVALKEVVGDNIWFGSDLGRLFKSSDRGTTWSAYQTPVVDFGGVTTSGSSGVFSFKDGSNGLLIAIDGSTSAALYSTNDGGATWDDLTPNGTWFFGDITYVPGTANTYVTTGINSNAAQGTGSSYTTDGGLNWTLIDNIAGIDGGQRGKLGFLNATTGWAGFFSDGPSGTQGILKFNGSLLAVSDHAVKSNLKVFPNPAVDVVKVTANKDVKSITIFDLSGKRVQTVKGAEANVTSLAKGNYILQVYYGDGAVENTKFIKK